MATSSFSCNGKEEWVLNFGSPVAHLKSPPQAWLSIGPSLKWASMSLQDQEHTTLTAALKSLISLLAFSFKYPWITGLPLDLSGNPLLLVCLWTRSSTTFMACASYNRLLHQDLPLPHTMDRAFLLPWTGTGHGTPPCEPETILKLQPRLGLFALWSKLD